MALLPYDAGECLGSATPLRDPHKKRQQATKTLLSISRAMVGLYGAAVQTRKAPLPQDVLLVPARKLS